MSRVQWCPMANNRDDDEELCIEHECAWWDKSGKCCAVLHLARGLPPIFSAGILIAESIRNKRGG